MHTEVGSKDTRSVERGADLDPAPKDVLALVSDNNEVALGADAMKLAVHR